MFAKNPLLKIAVCFTLLVVSCTTTDENSLPGVELPLTEMNQALVVAELPEMPNSHKNNEPLILQLQNKSQQRIVLPGDYGTKIFRKVGQTWVTVANNQGYPEGDVLLLSSAESPPGSLLFAIPFILDQKQPETIRVVILGHEANPETRPVGAYLELTLFSMSLAGPAFWESGRPFPSV